jgi:D,D-heptose 1,7-bisphosphate phosphatase
MKQAVILVGGKGTRLGRLTSETPKPMMDIGGRPFIHILIEEIARHGFLDIVLLCGHLAERIYSVFDDMIVLGARVRCLIEPQPMGTGGALLQAADQLDESFMLMNGDSFFDFNFLDLRYFSVGRAWLGKVALRPLQDTGRYGVVKLEGERITAFAEKAAIGPGLINGGVYILRRQVLDYINKVPCSLEQDVLPQLVAEGLIFGRAYPGYFIDIGIPEDLRRARDELPSRRRATMFFDRDGVLNHDAGYTHLIEDFRWMPGAIEAIKLCNDRGWLVIIVTNQAGIARGFYDEESVLALHRWMQEHLRQHGAHVDAIYICPHHPEGTVKELAIACDCRKPEPGMLRLALQEWPGIDVSSSWMIGDKPSDLEAAAKVGIRGRLFESGNLLELVSEIQRQHTTETMTK